MKDEEYEKIISNIRVHNKLSKIFAYLAIILSLISLIISLYSMFRVH